MRRIRFALAACMLLALGCVAEPTPTDGSGGVPTGGAQNWSDPNAWPTGLVPVAGDSVVIPSGAVVKLDVSPPALQSLTIQGSLVFTNTDLSLTAGWIVVQGTLQIGTESSPYTKRAIITLTGTGSSTSPNVYGMGNKVLGVTGHIELHGSERKGWTRLNQTAAVGATTIELASTMSWKAGDRLALASSDYSPDKAEEVVISSVSGRTVTLTAGLKYEHYGQVLTVSGTSVDERGEVGLLSRNITIQGDTGTTPGYGGHMMIMQGATAHIEGVELYPHGAARPPRALSDALAHGRRRHGTVLPQQQRLEDLQPLRDGARQRQRDGARTTSATITPVTATSSKTAPKPATSSRGTWA